MPEVPLEKLKTGHSYTADILDDQGAVLIPASTKITDELIQWITARNVKTVYSNDPKLALEADIVEAGKLITDSKSLEAIHFLEIPSFPELYESLIHIQSPRIRPHDSWYLDNVTTKTLDTRITYYPGWDKPRGPELFNELLPVPDFRTQEYKQEFLRNYGETLVDVKVILDKIAQATLANSKSISVLTERIIERFIRDKNLMLNFSLIKSSHKESIYHHSLNVCILAVNIATAIGYSYRQIHEIGIGALLHDVGMILVRPAIRYKTSSLTPLEQAFIHRHPIEGLFMISKIKNLPDSTPYVVYQHHEREDGSGYPRATRKRTLMHRFARIVSVADIFDAMTSTRPYRQAIQPYDAMLQLLAMVQRGKISSTLMRFFLEFSSLFPVGSYVRLNDGRMARVVESRSAKYTAPVVSVVQHSDNSDPQVEKLDLSKTPDIKIVSAVPTREVPNGSVLGEF